MNLIKIIILVAISTMLFATLGLAIQQQVEKQPVDSPINPEKLVRSIVFQPGAKEYIVDNSQIASIDVAPQVIAGRIFVPVRFLGHALGLTSEQIIWDAATQTITLVCSKYSVDLAINNKVITSNGISKTMDVVPWLADGRTQLPARFVAESLGYQTLWQNGLLIIWPIGEPVPKIDVLPETVNEYDLQTMTVSETIAFLAFLDSPVENAQVTTIAGQLPNAPRPYRNGIHEGIDYYLAAGTPVVAVGAGIIIRADHDFIEMTLAEYNEAVRLSQAATITPEKMLDKFRGQQVWLQHQNGIITRYAHLQHISPNIKVGYAVTKGQQIGNIGNSGTKSAVVGKILSAGGAPHLHFEVWLGDTYLGANKSLSENIYMYRAIFDY